MIPLHRASLLVLVVLLVLPAPLLAQQAAGTALPDRAPASLRICAGGDVLLGSNLPSTRTQPVSPDALLEPLRPLVAGADVVLLNVEGAIGEGAAASKCGPSSTNCYAFRQPIEAAAALRRLGGEAEVVGNLANNHARDAGDEGLRATVRHLSEAGVHVTGPDSLPTVVVTGGGDTVAILGFSTFSVGLDARDLAGVRRHVGRAAARYPRVVVSVHMGAEGRGAQRTRDETEIFLGRIDRGNPVAFAHAAVEAGADLVVGHGPHVMRAAEWHRGALILYSLGNLVTYGPFSNGEPLNRGAVACASLDAEGRVTDARLHPTRQTRPGRVEADPAARALLLVDSLSRQDFPRSGSWVLPNGTLPNPLGPVPEVVGAQPRTAIRALR